MEDAPTEVTVSPALQQRWTVLGVEPTLFQPDANGTLSATRNDPAEWDRTVVEAAPTAEFLEGDVLGEGGVGIVRKAHQTSLQRQVAIKSLRDANQVHLATLVTEARVMAALDHPNVPPIHSLEQDDRGLPQVVMKQVKGKPWRHWVGDDGDLIAPDPGADPLEWHLRVLMQVCSAVQFAHEHGVLHRDIKLSNVVIEGTNGVYLLDWGLARSIRGDDGLDLPLAADERDVVGTPGYMAPEMVDVSTLDERSDVYLLGACLHRVITGQPRNVGSTVLTKLTNAPDGVGPRFPAAVPRELRAIVSRATARRPEDRHPSAEALRADVATFLRTRSSVALANAAYRTLQRLEARLDEDGGTVGRLEDIDQAHVRDLEELMGEVAFGSQQALREWSANPVALECVDRLKVARARRSLDEGDAVRARALLEGARYVPPELEARLNRALERRRQALSDDTELHRLRALTDRLTGHRERVVSMLLIGGIWGTAYLALGALGRSGAFVPEHGTMLAVNGVHGLGVGLLQLLLFRSDRSSAMNRRFLGALWMTFVGSLLWWPAAMVLDVPFTVGLVVLELLYFLVTAMTAVGLEFRLFPATLMYPIAAALTVWSPRWHFEWLALATFCALTLGAMLWPRELPDEGS